jgi:DNA polymerase I-like protein with 3'-5' exonuclease and polymerase domains
MMHDGDINEYFEWLKEADLIGCDTENNGTVNLAELWSGLYYGIGISTAIRRDTEIYSRYFPFRHSADNLDKRYLESLKRILEVKQLGFHNIFIDIATMETFGITISIPPYDTITLAHLVNEEFPSKELDWLGKFILKEGKDDSKLKRWTENAGWDEDIPVKLMTPYACQDSELQLRLMEIFLEEMQP